MHEGERRALRPLRWVVPIGVGAGGISPPLVAIVHPLPSWAIVTMTLGGSFAWAASYVIAGWTYQRMVTAVERAHAFRETSVEEGRRATMEAALDGRNATLVVEHVDADGGRHTIAVWPTAVEQSPARRIDRRVAG
jgi:hypothetical protein